MAPSTITSLDHGAKLSGKAQEFSDEIHLKVDFFQNLTTLWFLWLGIGVKCNEAVLVTLD